MRKCIARVLAPRDSFEKGRIGTATIEWYVKKTMRGVLDYNTLLQVLNAASSPLRAPEQQNAEAQLKAWEAEKGFHYLLQSIYIDTQLSLQVRWLAVICLKNGVERYWRPTRINAITKEEKLEIRKDFSTLSESQTISWRSRMLT